MAPPTDLHGQLSFLGPISRRCCALMTPGKNWTSILGRFSLITPLRAAVDHEFLILTKSVLVFCTINVV
jgi:hypothetical protein